jgi:copper chaperone CopZ
MLIVSVVGSSTAWGIAAAAAGVVAIVAGALRWRGRRAPMAMVLAALAGVTAVAAPLLAAERRDEIVAERLDAHLEPHGLSAVDIVGSPAEPSLFDQFAPFLSGDAAELVATVEQSMHTDTQRGLWITVVGGAAGVIGAVAGLRRRPAGLRRSAAPQPHISAPAQGGDMTSATLTVTGMTCGMCVRKVTAAASTVDGVTDVDVQLPTGRVSVTGAGPLDLSAVRAAVDATGYRVTSVDEGVASDTPSGYVASTDTPQGYKTSTGGIR